MIYQLNYGIEYLGLGKVMCYHQKVSTQIARVPRTYVYVAENKEQGPHGPWKVLEFVKKTSRPGKSLETDKVLESPGIFFQ